jgi:hypothetical protein
VQAREITAALLVIPEEVAAVQTPLDKLHKPQQLAGLAALVSKARLTLPHLVVLALEDRQAPVILQAVEVVVHSTLLLLEPVGPEVQVVAGQVVEQVQQQQVQRGLLIRAVVVAVVVASPEGQEHEKAALAAPALSS